MNKYELAVVVNAQIDDEARAAVVENCKNLITKCRGCRFVLDILVNKSDNLVLLLQIRNQRIDVQRKQRDAAHNDQARRYDGNRSEGHEPVGADAAEALTNQVSNLTEAHNCNTHPHRH